MDDALKFKLTLPLTVGTVGGGTRLNAKENLEMFGCSEGEHHPENLQKSLQAQLLRLIFLLFVQLGHIRLLTLI